LTGATQLASVAPAWAQTRTRRKLEIAPLELEIAPGKVIHTVAYNGRVPGPLIRWPEGKPIAIDVFNRTAIPEIVHWHGLWIPSDMDGSVEEGGPMIAPGAQFRYLSRRSPRDSVGITPTLCRARPEARNLYRPVRLLLYRTQGRRRRVRPGKFPHAARLERVHGSASGDSSMEAAYDYGTIDGRMLGFGDPLKCARGSECSCIF
jgi:hypothetical protein